MVEELQARARDVLLTRAIATEEQLDGSAQSDDIFLVEGMTQELASTLAAAGILSREDLAEQSVDELTEIAPMEAQVAGDKIMSARAVWFEDEQKSLTGEVLLMAQVTVQQLAETVGTPVERLLEQLHEAGLPHRADEPINDTDKAQL